MTENNGENDLDLVELVKVWGPAEMEIIKTMLESYGIPCLLRGQVVQSVLPYTVDGMGEVKCLVFKKDLAKAKKLIEQAKIEE
jgi:hypothetical protein